jgi:hypothetical protein
MGSGKIIRHSLRKYGKKNHDIEILKFVETREILEELERLIITDDILKDKMCMNLQAGGCGFQQHSDYSKGIISEKLQRNYKEIYGDKEYEQKEKRKKSALNQWKNINTERLKEIKNKISVSLKIKLKDNPIKLDTHKCPHCNKIGKGPAMIKHHFNNCPIYTGEKRKGLSKESKIKISETLKSKPPISEETRKKLKGRIPKNKGIKSERTICPYCKKDVAISVMNRNHFNNCKYK